MKRVSETIQFVKTYRQARQLMRKMRGKSRTMITCVRKRKASGLATDEDKGDETDSAEKDFEY